LRCDVIESGEASPYFGERRFRAALFRSAARDQGANAAMHRRTPSST
jgi:hypothetical protein